MGLGARYMKKINMVGKKYKKWTVLSESRKDERGQIYYICRCDCEKGFR
jgi:hypothetical protein